MTCTDSGATGSGDVREEVSNGNNRLMSETNWTDDPLSTSKDDTLDRLPYAARAAELIHSTHSYKSSAVFGLTGPWGSGKTSLVNMIVEELLEAHPEWAVARFTPWATSDVAGLVGEFYSSLAQALPKRKRRHIRKALAVTAAVAAPTATLIPLGGQSAAMAIKTAGDALAKSPTWEKAFKEASALLKKLKIPILVVVDDIDRLHVDELMALLKVVRLLGRFDGVEYLLAYDDDTLYRSLSVTSGVSENDGSAERFMEKIVQYPLLVPPLLSHQQIFRLRAGLKRVSRASVQATAEERRLSGMLDCFLALLRTPRAIDRYIAQLQHHIPLVPADEIDDVDVQLLTLIRVSFPSLFNSIPLYRRELISGNTGELVVGGPTIEYKRFDPAPLLDLVPVNHRSVAHEILVSLFPKTIGENQIAVNSTVSNQGVANEQYFDRYFAMGIPAHDVSDQTVAEAVQAACGGNRSLLVELVLNAEDDRRLLILSKGTYETNQPKSDEGRRKLATALAHIANELPSDDGTPFGPQDQVLTWFAMQVVSLETATTSEVVLGLVSELGTVVLRIRAWRRVESLLERLFQTPAPAWHAPVKEALAEVAFSGFVEHLLLGDTAPTAFGIGYQLDFAMRCGRTNDLKAAISDLIASERIDPSILASRIVSATSRAGGTDWELSPDFDQQRFDELAPIADDPWYDQEPIEDLDWKDVSWANRRKFVQGRVRRPS